MDFLQTNVFNIFTVGVTILGFVIWLVRLESNVKNLTTKVSEINSTVKHIDNVQSDHLGDDGKHVNRAYMERIEDEIVETRRSIDKLEIKIDKISDRLYEQK